MDFISIVMRVWQVLYKIIQLVKNTAESLLNICYPCYCIRCDHELKKQEKLLCDDCWNCLPQLGEDVASKEDLNDKYRERIYFSGVLSVWQFDPHVQTVIHFLKYQHFKSLAKKVGAFMAEKVVNAGIYIDQSLLIPVPLHKTRTRERGYNQSELLCQAIAGATGIEYEAKILKRIRYTLSQTNLNVKQRSANVKNAFKVNSRDKLKNKTVILVDDVITTGATMNACAKELIKNGAKEIIILSATQA